MAGGETLGGKAEQRGPVALSALILVKSGAPGLRSPLGRANFLRFEGLDVSGGVFISYRREDSAGFARLIYDRLTKRLERANVFIDVDNIEPGLDFVEILSEQVAQNATRSSQSSDEIGFRQSIRTKSDASTIPMISSASKSARRSIAAFASFPSSSKALPCPTPDDLPDGLKKLARRQAIEISHTRFNSDVERLTNALELVEEELRRHVENEAPQTRSADAATAKSFRQAEKELETAKRAQSPVTDETSWRNALLNAFRLLDNKGLLIGSAIPESILEKARKYSGTDEILVIDHMFSTNMHIFGLRGLYSHVVWNTKQMSWSELRNCNTMRRHGDRVYIKQNFMIVPQHMSSKELLKLLNFLRQEFSLPT